MTGSGRDPDATADARGMGWRFWSVWTASSVTFLGDGLSQTAMPLLVLTLTDDTRVIAAVSALAMAGWPLVGIAAGTMADRRDRLRIMAVANAARFALSLGLFAAVFAQRVSVLAVMAFALVSGLLVPFFDNAASASVPTLVPEGRLEKANSMIQISLFAGTSFLGPPLGTFLFGHDRWLPFLLDGLSFGICSWILFMVVTRRRSPGAGWRAAAAAGSVSGSAAGSVSDSPSAGALGAAGRAGQDRWAGVRYLFGDRSLRTLAFSSCAVNATVGGMVSLFPIYALRHLDVSQNGYGALLSVFAVGGLCGGVASSAVVRRLGGRVVLVGALVAFSASALLLGVFPVLAVAVPMLVVAGAASVLWNVASSTHLHRHVPDDILGRTSSVSRMIGFLGSPVGAVGAGVLAYAAGAPHTYAALGMVLVLAALFAARGFRPAGATATATATAAPR